MSRLIGDCREYEVFVGMIVLLLVVPLNALERLVPPPEGVPEWLDQTKNTP
jgi:hypothetical protein